ncbi:MAG TPA: hypothetical protein PLV92_01155, partial [Pirellulaceae bacterium]|nr:hypothetical protein [Pirellulaceae bacterium]
SNRSMITHAPVLTMPNGGFGSVSDSSYLPFVTGIVPVVGDGSRFGVGPVGPPPVRTMSPLAERLRRLEQGERGGVRPIVRPRGAGSSSSTIATVSANSPLTAGPAIGTAAARPNSSGDASLALNGGSGGRSSGGGASIVSTAERGDLSVAEIRRQQAAADEALAKEITDLIAEARQLEEAGRPGQARIYYQRAATRATGDQLRELKTKIAELERLAKRK